VVNYFTGESSECQQIDAAIRAQTRVKKSDIRMGKTIQAQQSQMYRKRDQKASDKEEIKLEVCDYLLQNEKKIHSRSTVI
jgi:hypothetical protein